MMEYNNDYYDLYGNRWSEEENYTDVLLDAQGCVRDEKKDYYVYQNGKPVFRYLWVNEPFTYQEECDLREDHLPFVCFDDTEGYYYLEVITAGVNIKMPEECDE